MVKACEWADFHPALEPGDEAFEDEFLPGVHYDCTATFALNIGLSDAAGTNLIHEALQLRHRLPRTWARVRAGEVTAWRARRIAAKTLYQPDDVTSLLDATVARIAHKVGPITLDRLIDETKMRLHPVETEQAQIDHLERHEVWLDPNMSHDGCRAHGDPGRLRRPFAFDKTVSDIAAVIGDLGNTADLDVRRALAIGVLADPQAAADLLTGDADALKKPSTRKHIQLVVHITDDTTTGDNPIARLDRNGGMPILEQQVRAWCGRTDTGVTITPLIDLAENIAVPQYEVPNRIKTQIAHRDLTCVFPHCTRPAAQIRQRPHRPPPRRANINRQRRSPVPKTPSDENPRRLDLPTHRPKVLPLDQPTRTPIPPRPRRHHRNRTRQPANSSLPRAG